MIFFGHLGISLLFAFVVFSILKEDIDYRFILLGAILPDLIDKPLGEYIFYSTFQNGRIFAHTLLFVFALTVLGMYVARKYHTNFLELLALGSLLHIAEDQVWKVPGTLFWPLFGLEFPKLSLGDYAGYILDVLLTHPDAYIPEILGLLILATFAAHFKLYRTDRLTAFLASGRLSDGQSHRSTAIIHNGNK